MNRLSLVALFMIAIVVGWWALEDAPSPKDSQESSQLNPSASAAHGSAAEPTTPKAPIKTEKFTPPSVGPRAIIRGRCVSQKTGEAVNGATVNLNAFLQRRDLLNDYKLRGIPSRWEKALRTFTDAKGRFEFVFEATPKFLYGMSINADGHADIHARYPPMETDDILEIGDLELPVGVMVTGTVSDQGKLPVAGAEVSLRNTSQRSRGTPRPTWNPTSFHSATTNSSGHLSFKRPLLPGTWQARVEGRVIVQGGSFVVASSPATRTAKLVVESLEEALSISGIVTDIDGHPVPDVRIHSVATQASIKRSSRSRAVRTQDDGTFKISVRGAIAPTPVRLIARKRGFLDLVSEHPVTWGATGIRLVLQESPGIELLVVDADTQKPVEEYGIHFFENKPAGHQLRTAIGSMRISDVGQHAGGLFKAPGLSAEPHMLQVKPVDPSYAPSRWEVVELSSSRAKRHLVKVYRNAQKTIKVLASNGEPVVGSEVDVLLRVQGESIDALTRPYVPGTRHNSSHIQAIKLAGGTTNTQGELQVIISPDQECVVRALGPGHTPRVVPDIKLARNRIPLVVNVKLGARIEGRITPALFLDQIRSQGGKPSPSRARKVPAIGISLTKTNHRDQVLPVKPPYIPIEADGSFRIANVPPGDWDLKLHHWYHFDGGSGSSSTSTPLTAIKDLRAGETRNIPIDASHLLKGTLNATVSVNGDSPGECSAQCTGVITLPDGGHRTIERHGLHVDASGRISTNLLPGTYYLMVMIMNRPRSTILHSTEAFTILPGAATQQSFDFVTHDLKVRILAADGITPVRGIAISAGVFQPYIAAGNARTDSKGIATFKQLPAGPYDIFCRPRALQDEAARLAFVKDKSNRYADAFRLVGDLTLAKGTKTVTLTLPTSVGY